MAEAWGARERGREGGRLDSSCLMADQTLTSHSSGYATERDYSPEKVLIQKQKIVKKRKLLLKVVKNL